MAEEIKHADSQENNIGMSEYRTEFSDDELKGALGSREGEAQKILEDEGKLNQLIQKAKNLLEKIKKVPVIGKIVDDLLTLFELIGDYAKGSYRQIPYHILVSATAGIIY